jgi:hypothetical protein
VVDRETARVLPVEVPAGLAVEVPAVPPFLPAAVFPAPTGIGGGKQ